MQRKPCERGDKCWRPVQYCRDRERRICTEPVECLFLCLLASTVLWRCTQNLLDICTFVATINLHTSTCKKVKFSHTRYRALGPELIPVYRQSAGRWLLSHHRQAAKLSGRPSVTYPAEERHLPSTSTKLYCLVIEAHRCEQLAQGCYAALSRWELNQRLTDCKSNDLQRHHCNTFNMWT